MPGCDTPSVAGQLETTTQPKVIYHFVKKDAKDAKIAFSPTVNFSFFYAFNSNGMGRDRKIDKGLVTGKS